MAGLLNTDVSDHVGEAAVRDTDESIEVLLVQKKIDDRVYFLPWIADGRQIPRYEIPDDELAKKIARCSVRLPAVLCAPWMIDRTIHELEAICMEQFPEWQQSPWLKGDLFLVLDEAQSASLGGFHLTYDRELGLLNWKEDKAGD
jgi:hypothetical protein